MRLVRDAALALLGFAPLALAHTPLVSSIPQAEATVTAPVREIVLEFGEEVRLTALALADSGGNAIEMVSPPTEIAKAFTLAIRQDAGLGDFVATWRAVGADTHIISGEIRFNVVAPPAIRSPETKRDGVNGTR